MECLLWVGWKRNIVTFLQSFDCMSFIKVIFVCHTDQFKILSKIIWKTSYNKLSCFIISGAIEGCWLTDSTAFNCQGTFTHVRGGRGRKIGFNTNHYMRSHIRGRGAEVKREQNPLRNKWAQHKIFRIRLETTRSKPSLFSRNGRYARVRSAYVWTYPR